VPLIVRWPGVVKPGTESNALLCQVDFLACFARMLGKELPANVAPDSFETLDGLLGKSPAGREHLVEHAGQASLRLGDWKFIPASNGPAVNKLTNTELGNARQPQLYDLSRDIGERTNLADSEKSQLEKMRTLLDKIRKDGFSRPGFSR